MKSKFSVTLTRLQVQMFENRRGRQAHQEILRLLDLDHDGKVSAEERSRAEPASLFTVTVGVPRKPLP